MDALPQRGSRDIIVTKQLNFGTIYLRFKMRMNLSYVNKQKLAKLNLPIFARVDYFKIIKS